MRRRRRRRRKEGGGSERHYIVGGGARKYNSGLEDSQAVAATAEYYQSRVI
jgi:hypothetical protein